MTPERFAKINSVLAARQPDLTVLMENVHKPHNYAAVLRSCDAVGCFEAHGVFNDIRLSHRLASAAGARKWVQVCGHASVESAIEVLRKRSFSVVAAHRSAHSIDFRDYDFTAPTCVLLGQELEGVTETALSLVDAQVHVPMHGMVESLNVSVAAAVILFEAQRQREKTDLYRGSRLDEHVLRRTRFEWAHPRIAEVYRRRSLPFPPLNSEGQIVLETSSRQN